MERPSHKRRKQGYNVEPDPAVSRKDDLAYFPPFDEIPQDFWTTEALYALEAPEPTVSRLDQQQRWDNPQQRGGKRGFEDDVDCELISAAPEQNADFFMQWTHSDPDYFIFSQMPELFPSVPSTESRIVDTSMPNPLASDIGKPRHPTLERRKAFSKDGAVCGYIKFRIRSIPNSTGARGRLQPTTDEAPKQQGVFPNLLIGRIPNLPPDFGRGIKLDAMDEKLLKFFLVGYCEGRTLLSKDNLWLVDIAPMLCRSECVKHSLLSFASGYVLDFVPESRLQARANLHHARAVKLLGDSLKDAELHEPGKEESLIASLMLLLGDDIVNWELRKPPGEEPRWFSAARTAKKILDTSDPGYRFAQPENVQMTQARLSCSNWVAFVNILADVVSPYSSEGSKKVYPWLIEGSRMESRKIHGGTGASPKLFHTLAQITHLSSRLSQCPDDPVIALAAERIAKRLEKLHQWSDLSPGYTDLETLISDCGGFLDAATGKVNNAAMLTDLTGHAWIAAAQIYLQCRLYRRPRTHPDVAEALHKLVRCIKLMPFQGILFTAQSPFFAIFIMALVAIGEGRKMGREWFETVCVAAGDRSSVPPLWESLKRTWAWMDGDGEGGVGLREDSVSIEGEEEKELGQRIAWWEQLVEWVVEHEGVLSLV